MAKWPGKMKRHKKWRWNAPRLVPRSEFFHFWGEFWGSPKVDSFRMLVPDFWGHDQNLTKLFKQAWKLEFRGKFKLFLCAIGLRKNECQALHVCKIFKKKLVIIFTGFFQLSWSYTWPTAVNKAGHNKDHSGKIKAGQSDDQLLIKMLVIFMNIRLKI